MTAANLLRPLLWGLLLMGAVAVSVHAVRDEGRDSVHDEGEAAAEPLVPLPAEELAAIEVLKSGRLSRFDRTPEGQWFLHPDEHSHALGGAEHVHTAPPESSARIAQAFAMFGRARIERQVGTVGEDRKRFGLVFPDLVVSVFTAGRPRPVLTLEVGDLAPDGLSRYVLAVERGAVMTIPDYHIANLTALLSVMQSGGAAKPDGG